MLNDSAAWFQIFSVFPPHSPPPPPSCGGRRRADVGPYRWCKTNCRFGSSWCCRWGLGGRPWRWEARQSPRSRWLSGYHCLADKNRILSWSLKKKNFIRLHQLVFLYILPAVSRMLRAVGCQLTMPTRLECPSRTTTGSDRGRVSEWSGICQTWRRHRSVISFTVAFQIKSLMKNTLS